jgi:hypothetical protein
LSKENEEKDFLNRYGNEVLPMAFPATLVYLRERHGKAEYAEGKRLADHPMLEEIHKLVACIKRVRRLGDVSDNQESLLEYTGEYLKEINCYLDNAIQNLDTEGLSGFVQVYEFAVKDEGHFPYQCSDRVKIEWAWHHARCTGPEGFDWTFWDPKGNLEDFPDALDVLHFMGEDEPTRTRVGTIEKILKELSLPFRPRKRGRRRKK